MTPPPHVPTGDASQERRLRRSWWLFSGSLVALGLLLLARLVGDSDSAKPADAVAVVLATVVGVTALLHRHSVRELETGRRDEVESFARILQGLSRSISPDAIVDAIVEELGIGAGADHMVIVRRRPDQPILDATLVSSRAGVPSTVTRFPMSDLEDPSGRAQDQRDPVAVPIVSGRELELATAGSAGSAISGSPAGAGWASAPARDGGGLAGATRISGVAGRGAPLGARNAIALVARAAVDVTRRYVSAVPPASVGRRHTDAASAADGLHARPAGDGGAPGRIAEQIAERARTTYGLRNTLAAPLLTEAGVVGAIVLSRRGPEPWPASAKRLLDGAATEASAALARATHHRAAEARATTDALTGLPNRRYFDEFCGLLARRRRADDAVGVLLIDIDRFKLVNDTWGHAAGDVVLRAVAGAIGAAVREGDVPARYGGEEFAVLLRNPSLDVAADVGERVRAAVGRLDLKDAGPERVSVSVGVAVAEGEDQPMDAVIGAADRALYEAKRQGRDRVVAA